MHLEGPWSDRAEVETATANWVHWFNTERIHSMLDDRTPAEVEAAHIAETTAITTAA